MITDIDLKEYMRYHPKWYLIISRYPKMYEELKEQYKIENKLTLADSIEKVGMMLSMIDLFL
jgi:hypothetical protein